MKKQRLFTGLQPSGNLHIGNYFGVLQPFLNLYPKYDSFLMVADYHSLTSSHDSQSLRENTLNIVRDYLAVGVDPEEVTIFRQSDNPDHTELAWILNCMVTVPFLQQGHAYKDKVAKGMEPNAGLFTYPMLQAADIALYDTDVVPVGEDQRQHLEYTREAVSKFNRTYGEIIKKPETIIMGAVGVVPGTDGQKMSKSYKNTVPLFGSKEEIEESVMRIITDSEGDIPETVLALHKLFKPEGELTDLYESNKGRYGDLKKALAHDINSFIEPMREKKKSITDADIVDVLEKGAQKAKEVSSQTMSQVRSAIGLNLI
ncbi:tryptophan--tRNA ligase [bacterium]|mgnify:CR=1 FL=1|nr:tryptophan--tRNA ligase [bacterium]|tara:strand:- start:531 stop:1475 length:945 start_codon:yes stop_codon:yes gene_type:complete